MGTNCSRLEPIRLRTLCLPSRTSCSHSARRKECAMTEEKGFGRRSPVDRQQAWSEYKGGMKALGKSLSIKQWVIAGLGIYVAIHMLVKSNDAGTKAMAPAAHAAQIADVQKPSCGVTLAQYNAVK